MVHASCFGASKAFGGRKTVQGGSKMLQSSRYSALALLLAALNLWGQADRGTIRGTVTDPAVAPVPQAKVIAVNVATGTQNPTTTTESGNYNITALPAGLYR